MIAIREWLITDQHAALLSENGRLLAALDKCQELGASAISYCSIPYDHPDDNKALMMRLVECGGAQVCALHSTGFQKKGKCSPQFAMLRALLWLQAGMVSRRRSRTRGG